MIDTLRLTALGRSCDRLIRLSSVESVLPAVYEPPRWMQCVMGFVLW